MARTSCSRRPHCGLLRTSCDARVLGAANASRDDGSGGLKRGQFVVDGDLPGYIPEHRAFGWTEIMLVDELSGDSSVLSVWFKDGQAVIEFIEGESDDKYLIEVPARWFRSDVGSESTSVHIRFEDLAAVLPVEPDSGRYTLPADFPSQMVAHRKAWILAVGLRQSEYPFLLRIGGSQILLATPVTSKESVVARLVPP